ncbi:hypothetical protein [Enorma phocaeensis]|uniref:hypothetical protein n=1 Tax=Enorma phocaeensis TaxID=1871019 RepID=UPI0023562D61|nr:hypothetical protein [Enorma phocaeensis]
MNAIDNKSVQRHGLLAPTDAPPETALARGLLTGSAIAVAMLLISTLLGIAAIGMTPGLAISLSSIIAGMAGGILQQIWFNPNVLRVRLSYASRIPLFGITYFAILVICAQLGSWLPSTIAAWATFTVGYLAVFAILTIVFSLRYRKQSKVYAEHLAEYRKRQR